MANKRLITSDMFRDDFYIELDLFGRNLWVGLIISAADDQGRMLDNAALIRSAVFPADDISLKEIESAIDVFVSRGKLLRYEKNGKKLIQITNWWKHQNPQWPSPSNFPAPDGWIDRVKYKAAGNKVCSLNWEKEGGFNSNTDQLIREDTYEDSNANTYVDTYDDSYADTYEDSNADENVYENENILISAVSPANESKSDDIPISKIKPIKPEKNKKEIPKKEFGEFKNVRLTDDEFEKLKSIFPDSWSDWIEKLSCWKKSKNKTTASDYATIRNWARREAVNRPHEQVRQKWERM